MPITIDGSGTITGASTLATTSARVATTSTGFALTDFTYISAAVFR
jgi:hypothetical protein